MPNTALPVAVLLFVSVKVADIVAVAEALEIEVGVQYISLHLGNIVLSRAQDLSNNSG
jgi:hypothetical protein